MIPKYHFCLGIILDGNCSEKTCKFRENCKLYLHDMFERFPAALGEGEMVINEPGKQCVSYMPKQEIVEKQENGSPFFDEDN